MRLRHLVFAPFLVAALAACAAAQDKRPDAKPADPLATFSRLVSDEWRVTFASGKSFFHTWHWGPGKHSIRRMTDGYGAGGEPWREVQVFYWHPGRKQVCLLGVSPVMRGVSEGTIKFEGDTADGVFDIHQDRGRRKTALRWAFDGPDKFRDTLLEATGPVGYQTLAEWDHVRVKPPAVPRPRAVEGVKPSERLKPLEPLLGRTWESRSDALSVQSKFEWVPLADAVYARVVSPAKDGEHLLDAYLYHHTGAKVLRCLALSNRGGVYEGDITVRDGGALELDVKGYEGGREVRHVVRFDFEKDGTLRQRVWSLKGTERTPTLDIHHKKLQPKKD